MEDKFSWLLQSSLPWQHDCFPNPTDVSSSEFTGQRGGRITATAGIVNNHFILWPSACSVWSKHPAGSLLFSFKGTFMKIKQRLRNQAACKNLFGFYCVSPHFFHWSWRCHVFYFKLSFCFLAQGAAASSKRVIYTSEFVHMSKKKKNLKWPIIYSECGFILNVSVGMEQQQEEEEEAWTSIKVKKPPEGRHRAAIILRACDFTGRGQRRSFNVCFWV